VFNAHRLFLKGLVPVATLALLPAVSHAQVIVLGAGYTEECASAAQHADDSKSTLVTGSRLELRPLEICTHAIREDVENRAANYNNRGVIHFSQQNYNAALRDFEVAIQLQEDRYQFHFNLGLALVRLERWAQSLEAFDRGFQLGGPTPGTDSSRLAEIYYNRGIANEESGNTRQAYDDYRRALELAPDWELPTEELARFSVRR